ncbi:MAG TPA: glycoside hydrolase family 3 C-terminal domain-containing protein [Candidatus Dormibacteraeota bacterium]|nr:glycoside hydrolase family 3 C-terminal domain-containing protein [Candidatus Dormibacteraeota bacterium]
MPIPDSSVPERGRPAHHVDGRVIAQLSLVQKVRLLTGADGWTLHGEPTVGLRSVVMSDGPAGVRGRRFDRDNPSSSLPCPVALAATWDVALVEQTTRALGEEARARGVDVLLAPTVNLVRTPLSGRGFECFSEDPLLTARMAVAYVRGLQAVGVAATAKHFVANDSETDRRNYDARVAESVLRELYLAPFEACVLEADVALVMAAYNSVNGAPMTANAELVRGLLKDEWGFKGVVVSDWSATKTTGPSARAGLDLVMPGPGGPWGDHLLTAVRTGLVSEAEIDDKVVRLLHLAGWLGAIGNGHLPSQESSPSRVDPTLLRELTARSFVLLRNHRNLLPLTTSGVRRVAVIGPNAVAPQKQGGGSVRVFPVVRPGIIDSLRGALGNEAKVSLYQGCLTWATIPAPTDGSLIDPVSGEPGVRVEVRNASGATVSDAYLPSSAVTWWDGLPDAVNRPGTEVVMRANYHPKTDGGYVVGAAGIGLLRVIVDGVRATEAITLPPRDTVEALSRPPEVRVPVRLEAGRKVELRFEHYPDVRGREGFVTMRLGIAPEPDEDRLMAEAVEAARSAEVAIVMVGLADGTESEGYDRETLALPGRQDELVTRIAAANPNTIVVVNSGMPVLMPWADDVAAILQVWYPGQAFGEALADVLTGAAEPGGRLPVTLPRAEADSPVLRAHPQAGEVVYAEGLLVGYRGYDRKGSTPLYCFGHGLGYTDWTYESLTPATVSISADDALSVAVKLRNAGERAGREVVQLYLEGPDDDASRPLRSLAGFALVHAEPGQTVEARVTVPPRTFARFDAQLGEWTAHPGTYRLHAGRSSRDLKLAAEITVGRR